MQEQEELRRQLTQSLREAEEEADREGWFTIGEVAAEIEAMIDAAEGVRRI
jgi:hypothetical protein